MNIVGIMEPGFEHVLTPDALGFVELLANQFSERLSHLLERRAKIAHKIRQGVLPDFLGETTQTREGSWKVGPIPPDLRLRRVEITGPVERKMMINALNSGADVYMADFEDSHSPTWKGTIQGQLNLREAVQRKLEYTSPDGKEYRLKEKVATLVVRPRGLHLEEKHVLSGSHPVPASFFDFGLYLYHNAGPLIVAGSSPYFYLPKLESHLEARLWNDVFEMAEEVLGLAPGTIKCSVLVENILAAFEMDEILYELRNHITALNFGRWDYIFSFIKKLGYSREFVLPERSLLTMSTRFLESCSLLLVQTCHKRGAYAIGGMAAQVPIRNNPEAQAKAFEKVISDKQREVAQGYDGAWVAHPDLVPVVTKVFSEHMTGTNQLHVVHKGLKITAQDLLSVPHGTITEEGIRTNVEICLRYLESWLKGSGCVAIHNLMEDTATVEIIRTQIWQWIHHQSQLSNGRTFSLDLFREILRQELTALESENGQEGSSHRLELAGRIMDFIVAGPEPAEFMPVVANLFLD